MVCSRGQRGAGDGPPRNYGAQNPCVRLASKDDILSGGLSSRKTPKENTPSFAWCAFFWSGLRGSNPPPSPWQGDALPNELTPQMWCLRSESNQRHGDFQSPALPTELQRQGSGCKKVATRMGLEPTTSSVTG